MGWELTGTLRPTIGEQFLQAITNEITARMEADQQFADDLAVEVAARMNAGSAFTSRLNDLQSALTSEVVARQAAVQALADSLIAEINARKAADNFVYYHSTPSTVWDITHNLGFDPAGIVVTDTDGYIIDGFGIQVLVTGVSLRLAFDVSVAGSARLS